MAKFCLLLLDIPEITDSLCAIESSFSFTQQYDNIGISDGKTDETTLEINKVCKALASTECDIEENKKTGLENNVLLEHLLYKNIEEEIEVQIDDPDYLPELNSKHEEDEEMDADDGDPNYVPETTIHPQDDVSNDTAQQSDLPEMKRKRNKRQFVDSKTWNESKRKSFREKGKEYLGRKMVDGKWRYDLPKEERKMQEWCNCKPSLRENSVLKCRDFSETKRENIFDNFWSEMTWSTRKVYVSLLIVSKPINRQRNRKEDNVSRRSETLEYYLKKAGDRLRVCKQMFLRTHCVKENMVLDWLKEIAREKNINKDVGENTEKQQGRISLLPIVIIKILLRAIMEVKIVNLYILQTMVRR
nr:uncharacterized protein LOC111419865 [Onthophagus taurus]